jgi:WD repeat-containing protein 48
MEPKQCFSTEVYAVDLGIKEVSDELKFNVGQQVTYSLFEKWDKGYNNSRDGGDERGAGDGDRDEPGAKGEGEKREKRSSPSSSPGKAQQKSSSKSNANKQADWPFSFKNNPCIITTTASGEWFRKRINDLDGSETSEVLPEWVVSCVADAQLPAGLDLKFSFHLLPTEDSDLPTLQQGKLLAPRILLVSKVLNYVANKLTEQNVDVVVNHSGQEQQQARDQKGVDANDLELLCNGKLLTPEMSLAKVRQSVWKRSDDIAIQYRVKG